MNKNLFRVANILFLIASCRQLILKINSRFWMQCYRSHFQSCGNKVVFDPLSSNMTYGSIKIGSHVFVGNQAWFSSSPEAPIQIGSFVMFGPRVTMLCGDHETQAVGMPMYLVTEKAAERSGPIVIEDDVWIGANVTILKGVTIGRGSVVAAGSVVTHSIPSNHIAAGVPARLIRSRISPADLSSHTKKCDEVMVKFSS